MRLFRCLTGLLLLAASASYGDVTLRYKMEFKLNSSLPEAMTQQAMKGLDSAIPQEIVMQFKGSKGYSTWGSFSSITDFSKKEITIVDTAGKRFATLPLDKLAEEMAHALPAMPDAAKAALASLKGGFQSRATGRTAAIQGIQAEEREMVMTIDGPPMGNAPAGPMMKMVIQVWMAKSSEAMQVPAVRELAGYNLWNNAMMNPMAMVEQVLKAMPGFGDNIAAMIKDMRSGSSVVLRTHTEMFMPMIGAMLKSMPAGTANPFGDKFDPDAAFMQSNQETTEISTAAVPDSVFQLPEGVKAVPAGDILKDLMAKMTPKQ